MTNDDATQDDQSMEEILQSIKSIISEEEGDESASEPADKAAAVEPKKPANSDTSASDDEGGAMGSDILELVDAVEDDTKPSDSVASIEDIIDSTINEDVVDKPKVEPKPEPVAKVADTPTVEKAEKENPDDSKLLSETAAAASAVAFDALAKATEKSEDVIEKNSNFPDSFRSGETVEDLVLEGLRPLLKEWLDDNLPDMINRLVKREIEKISHR
jgi:cell pole-organizing protein PopZ